MELIKKCWRFWVRVVVQFLDDECALRSASLAYTTLLSLVPLMFVSFTLVSAFPMVRGLTEQLQSFVFSNFVASSAEIILKYLQQFVQQASQLSPIGILFLVIAAVLLIFNIELAFNKIWHVKKRRHGVSAFLLYWGVLTLTPILIGLGFAISSYLGTFKIITGAVELLGAKKILLPLLPYLLTCTAFTLLYMAVPNCKVPFKCAIFGGVIATLLFEFAKFGFGWYVTSFPTYRLLYGALASVPIFLVWIYVSWLVILFGAVVSFVSSNK